MEKLSLDFEHLVLDGKRAGLSEEEFNKRRFREKEALSRPIPLFTPEYFTKQGFVKKKLSNFDGKESQTYFCKGNEGYRLDENGRVVEHRVGREHPVWGNDHVIEFEYDPEDGYLVREEERQALAGPSARLFESRYVYAATSFGTKVLDKIVLQRFGGEMHNRRGPNVGPPVVVDFSDIEVEDGVTAWEASNFAL